MTKARNKPVFVLLKISPVRGMGFDTKDVIGEHNAIAEKYGTVWLGKSGRALSQTLNDLVKDEIRENRNPQLILLYGTHGNRNYFVSPIVSIQKNRVPPLSHVPEYYRDNSRFITQWFELGVFEKMAKSELAKLVVASSQRPVADVALRCQAPYMIVTHKTEKE